MKATELNNLQRYLKPCPFCGGTAKLAPMIGARSWWRVRCDAYLCGGTTWAMQGHMEALEAWNRRANGKE